MAVVRSTCDSCRRLRLKCLWEDVSFSPCCGRCTKYGLHCTINLKTWPSTVMEEFIATFPHGTSRAVHWGPSSNAAGHPMDLHVEGAPPAAPVPLRPTSPRGDSASISLLPKSRLNISPKVREHLYSIFFDYIVPVWPIVTQKSLQKYPANLLLDGAILGIAARHHRAIVSWRDVAHIRQVLKEELRDLSSLTRPYAPTIQTVQALLIVILRFELCTESHVDILRFPFRLALACKMAQDLNIHRTNIPTLHDDENDIWLKRRIWAACMFQDAFVCASLGQPVVAMDSAYFGTCGHIGTQADGQNERIEFAKYPFFFNLVALSGSLRLILRTVYGTTDRHPVSSEKATKVFRELDINQQRLDSSHDKYDTYSQQALQMFLNNNRLLFILGLRSRMDHEHSTEELFRRVVTQQGDLLILDACQTVEQSSIDLWESPAGFLGVTLYCLSRSLMIVVDVLRDALCRPSYSNSFVERLQKAVYSARLLKEFLLEDDSWGVHWTQGHTLQTVLACLDQKALPESQSMVINDVFEESRRPDPLEMAASQRSMETTQVYRTDVSQDLDPSNVLFNLTDWDAYFAGCDQEAILWPSFR